MFDEDVVDHIAKILEILDLINIPGVDSHQLRMKVFPISLADDARQWWISEGDGKIINWEELGINPLEFISRVNSSFKNHKKVDGRTEKVLFYSWMNGNWNKRHVDNSVLSNNEWKESNYGNPPNTATDTFFKAYEEGNKLRQMKRKDDNKNNEQLIKRFAKPRSLKL
nr:hypothetical protein [Tanacetum cinerariifolium]